MSTQTYTFTNAANYTLSNSDLIKVSGGYLQLRDQRETFNGGTGTFYANYTSNINGTWGDGTLTGTATGGAGVSGGKLDLAGATKYVNYPGASNADSAQTLCVRMLATPKYSGTPADHRYFFSIAKATSDIDNLIQLYHNSAGNIAIAIYDSTGTVIKNSDFGAWSPTADTEYEIELNVDITTGATRLFIDGTQKGSTLTETGTRDTTIAHFGIGVAYNEAKKTDMLFDDILIFSTVQHTANYTPGATIPQTIYSTANPYVDVNATFKSSDLLVFTETPFSKTGSDEFKYCVNVGGVLKWNNAGTVGNSNGTYSQANTDDEITSTIGDFVNSRIDVSFRIFVHSDNGTTNPQLDTISVTFDSVLADPTLPTLIEIEGYVGDHNSVEANETIKIRPYNASFVNESLVQLYKWKDLATTDANGWFEADIFLQPSGEYWEFKIGSQRYKIELTDTGTNIFKDVIVEFLED
jgi:hypothetical protein